jgi:hypothetical protein
VATDGHWDVSRGTCADKGELIASTTNEVKEAVTSFVRSVVQMGQQFSPLPRERRLEMRLYFNPANPPPAGFMPSDDFEGCQERLAWAAKPDCFPLGNDYATPHHSVQLRMKTLAVSEMQDLTSQDCETYIEPANVSALLPLRTRDDFCTLAGQGWLSYIAILLSNSTFNPSSVLFKQLDDDIMWRTEASDEDEQEEDDQEVDDCFFRSSLSLSS